jgi:esterase
MLNSSLLTAPGAVPQHWAFLLHGILGSSQNLRTVGRRLCAERPDWGFVMPDLRNHGESHGEAGPHTVAACARDLGVVANALGLAVETAIGHSFGGKLALAWGEAVEAAGGSVSAVWALDSPPGPANVALAQQSEVVRVVEALRAVPMPLARRDAIVPILAEMGFSGGLGQWMTTNLRGGDGGFTWRFALDGVEEMLRSYAMTDLWPWLNSGARRADVHVLRAGRSERWEEEELRRFVGARLTLHTLPDAGHWVHVDDPDGLHRLLAAGLGD